MSARYDKKLGFEQGPGAEMMAQRGHVAPSIGRVGSRVPSKSRGMQRTSGAFDAQLVPLGDAPKLLSDGASAAIRHGEAASHQAAFREADALLRETHRKSLTEPLALMTRS